MHAHKSKVTIQEDHRVEVQLPADFPEGPAEIIVLTSRQAGGTSRGTDLSAQRTLAALAELRSVQLTPEEQETLDAFETFRHEHPIRFDSLKDPDLLLAVLARKWSATLVTTNTRHFTGLGITLEDWTL